MTDYHRRWRYVTCDQLRAKGEDLCSTLIAVEDESRPLGELAGVIIDVQSRRVCYLVVEPPEGDAQMVPLDVTCFKSNGLLVTTPECVEAVKPFEPSAYGRYDDESMMALLFAPRAAA